MDDSSLFTIICISTVCQKYDLLIDLHRHDMYDHYQYISSQAVFLCKDVISLIFRQFLEQMYKYDFYNKHYLRVPIDPTP